MIALSITTVFTTSKLTVEILRNLACTRVRQNNAALESLECAAAATLRVCLRTQVPLELAAVVQATPALSTAAAAADKLFQQGFVGDLDGQKPTAKRQHALCHVSKLCAINAVRLYDVAHGRR